MFQLLLFLNLNFPDGRLQAHINLTWLTGWCQPVSRRSLSSQ